MNGRLAVSIVVMVASDFVKRRNSPNQTGEQNARQGGRVGQKSRGRSDCLVSRLAAAHTTRTGRQALRQCGELIRLLVSGQALLGILDDRHLSIGTNLRPE